MKQKLLIFFISVLVLSACTLLVPDLFDARIIKVEHLDGDLLAVYLQDADAGYIVKVNGVPFDCESQEDDPAVLVCIGPTFEPGEELIIEFFEDEQAGDPLEEFSFVVPEFPEELKDDDDDGVPNAEDECPGNPQKAEPGVCGCGRADTDSDSDGTPDCVDKCPDNPEKTEPDDNGCDTGEDDGDDDSDDDGVEDDKDKCPDDPDKVEPGVCGCGVSDADENDNGIPDCEDICEGGYSDLIGDPCDDDEDDDGIKDGADQCPYDPKKKAAGYCGCGKPETDTDGDGTPDCVDKCPEDKERIEPGDCGCSGDDCEDDLCPDGSEFDPVGDPCNHDEDGDGKDDWKDGCPLDPAKKHPGVCGCGVPDVDSDGDGKKDCVDMCPTEFGLGSDGCPLATPTPTPCPTVCP